MDNAVNALATTVSGEALWGVFNSTIPYIGVIVLASFGFVLIRRLIRGAQKGKASI